MTLEQADSQLQCTVATLDGQQLATCSLRDLRPADTSKVLLEPELTVRVPARFRVDEDPAEPTLVQLNRTGALRDARRGPFALEFASPNPAYPWGELPNCGHIIGVDLHANLELAPTHYELAYRSDRLTLAGAGFPGDGKN